MASAYDIVTIGGGLAGSLFAGAMAGEGARVLVVERESRFRDRVRGEALFPWGAAELEALGLRRRLLAAGARENRWWDDFLGPDQIGHRDTAAETAGGVATLTFYHPEMQETLLEAAAESGADIRRGLRATGVSTGHPASVTVDRGGRTGTIVAGMVVVAEGRDSPARRWAGFVPRRDPPRLRIAGLLFEGMSAVPEDVTQMVIDPASGQSSIVIPEGGGRVRVYVIFPSEQGRRFQGTSGVQPFVAEAIRTGARPEPFDGARAAGPLATFEGADAWVDRPYRDGVALIGDAAATCDPAWGQGLSLSVHDVRLLREALVASADRDVAGRRYAVGHDRAFATLHATEEMFTTLFLETGAGADARRERALPLIAEDPSRVPDAFMSGPDAAPVDGSSRARFFGEL